MSSRHFRQLGMAAVVVLALALGGCGNSKKGNGNGYGYAPQTHSGVPHTGQVSAG